MFRNVLLACAAVAALGLSVPAGASEMPVPKPAASTAVDSVTELSAQRRGQRGAGYGRMGPSRIGSGRGGAQRNWPCWGAGCYHPFVPAGGSRLAPIGCVGMANWRYVPPYCYDR